MVKLMDLEHLLVDVVNTEEYFWRTKEMVYSSAPRLGD